MQGFRFFQPIEVRYGDIDAQRHVNNARYFTYMELARAKYLQHLGLWDGEDFDEIGIILVEASCTFKGAITFGQPIHVGVHTSRIGDKSIETEYSIQDRETGEEMASGRAVLVAYDYRTGQTLRVPDHWREVIESFEASDR
jgi:acyl-CoA thioester hydrolase